MNKLLTPKEAFAVSDSVHREIENAMRPQPYDYATIGEYAEALIVYLLREEFARRDAAAKVGER